MTPGLNFDMAGWMPSAGPGDPAPGQFVRLSGAVEFFRCEASARPRGQSADQRLGRTARRGSLCAHQPSRFDRCAARLRNALVLQNVRLSDGVGALLIRRSAFAKLKRAVVRRRHRKLRVSAGAGPRAVAKRSRLRGRHAELPVIPAVEIGLRHLQAIGIEVIAERVRCLTGMAAR